LTTVTDNDHRYMQHALMLARRGLGQVHPNPAVGCVLVNDGIVVGRGWTQPSGRPHAETIALKQAGEKARGATAYVTLEPCAHEGHTGSCALALAEAGIERAVIALRDPDPRVDGKGLAILKAASIRIDDGVLLAEAEQLNMGFLYRVTKNRPMFTVKAATTNDGRMITRTDEPRWITGEQARDYGHMLRATHDAILVGINTVLKDDPMLNCRLEGLEKRSPIRIILDSAARLPLDSKLVQTANDYPVWLITNQANAATQKLEDKGVVCIFVENTHVIENVAKKLASQGLTRVLVEGGPTLISAFMKANVVDYFAWFRAKGSPPYTRALFQDSFLEKDFLYNAIYQHQSTRIFGDDVMETLVKY